MRVIAVLVIVVGLALVAGCQPKVESPPPTTTTAPPAAKAPASTPSTGGSTQAEEAAVAAADAWLKLVDEGKYDESWAQTAGFFRKAVTQADWAKQMKTFREPLGDLVSRKVQSKQYATALPGAPDGEYVVIQYEASYAKKKSAIETVTPLKDADGSWRVSGYFIK